jgi:hypothetical protein
VIEAKGDDSGKRVLRGDRSARRRIGRRVLRDSPFKKGDSNVEMPGDGSPMSGGSSWKRALTGVGRRGWGGGAGG